MASNPMQQFSVHKIGPEIKIAGIDLSFTNASLFMVISASIILLFLFFGSKEKKIVPNKIQLIAEMFYTFVAKMISDTACLLYTSPSPRDFEASRMPSSA